MLDLEIGDSFSATRNRDSNDNLYKISEATILACYSCKRYENVILSNGKHSGNKKER